MKGIIRNLEDIVNDAFDEIEDTFTKTHVEYNNKFYQRKFESIIRSLGESSEDGPLTVDPFIKTRKPKSPLQKLAERLNKMKKEEDAKKAS